LLIWIVYIESLHCDNTIVNRYKNEFKIISLCHNKALVRNHAKEIGRVFIGVESSLFDGAGKKLENL
jgi:hypothetical protein